MSRAGSLALALLAVAAFALFLRSGRPAAAVEPGMAPGARAAEVDREPHVAARRRPSEAPPSAPPGSAAEPRPIAVRVRDTIGLPVVGAAVASDEGERVLTDADGRAQLSAGIEPWTRLVATREGYAAAALRVPEPRPAELELVLAPEADLTGRVLTSAGDPAPGVTVLAFPAGELLAWWRDGFGARLQLDPRTSSARTDAQGRFAIGGLDPRVEQRLVAGGAGWIGERDPAVLARAGGPPVELRVARVFALGLRLVEADGAPARLSGAVGEGVGFHAVLADPDAFFVAADGAAAFLAGVPDLGGDHPERKVFAVGSRGSDLEHVPLQVSAEPPGYRRIETTLLLPPMVDGLEEQRVVLAPRASGFGELELVWPARAIPLDARGHAAMFAELSLRPLDDPDARPFSLALRARDAGRPLGPIPHGRYEARLLPHPLGFARAPQLGFLGEVEIGPEPATLRPTLAGAGSLEVEVRDAAGRPFHGPLTLFVGLPGPADSMEPSPPTGDQLDFVHPPYRLPLLAPGDHVVFAAARPPVDGWPTVSVRAGERARLELQLSE